MFLVGEEDILASWVGLSVERRSWWHQHGNGSLPIEWTINSAFGHRASWYICLIIFCAYGQ